MVAQQLAHAVIVAPIVPCPTCGTAITDRFCPSCGERRPSPHGMSVRHLASQVAEQVSSLDAKLVRTVALLFARPGALLVEYRRGARARYSTPLQLFVWTNIAFFFLVPALGIFDYRLRSVPDFSHLGTGWWPDLVRHRVHAAGSPEAYRVAYNAAVGGRMQALFTLVVPALALVLLVVHPRRRPMEHLLMAIYLAPVLMAELIGTFAAADAVQLLNPPRGVEHAAFRAALSLGFVLFGVHATFALRRAYGDRWPAALARGALLGFGALLFPLVYFWLVTGVTILLL